MDRNTLVKRRVVDGRRLLGRLLENGVPVSMACWAKTGDDWYWYMHIASDLVDRKGKLEAYREVLAALRTIEGTCISSSDLKLIGADDPMTREVLGMLATAPAGAPIRLRDERLSSVGTGDFYIYPRVSLEDINPPGQPYGARVRLMEDGAVLVSQTVRRDDGAGARYVVERPREKRVDPSDDAELGAAVRAALEGRL